MVWNYLAVKRRSTSAQLTFRDGQALRESIGLIGGNPKLAPETARTFTAGVLQISVGTLRGLHSGDVRMTPPVGQ